MPSATRTHLGRDFAAISTALPIRSAGGRLLGDGEVFLR